MRDCLDRFYFLQIDFFSFTNEREVRGISVMHSLSEPAQCRDLHQLCVLCIYQNRVHKDANIDPQIKNLKSHILYLLMKVRAVTWIWSDVHHAVWSASLNLLDCTRELGRKYCFHTVDPLRS